MANSGLPYIEFERRNVAQQDKEGVIFYTDVDFVKITQVGGKDTVEKTVPEFITSYVAHVQSKRVPPEHLRQIRAAYAEFKEGNSYTFDGTPMESLGLTPQQMKMLKELKVRAVEDLAECTEEAIHRMGMGGRSLKQRAIAFLENKPRADQATEITALRMQNETQAQQIAALTAGLAVLRQEQKLTPAPEVVQTVSYRPAGEVVKTDPVEEDILDDITKGLQKADLTEDD